MYIESPCTRHRAVRAVPRICTVMHEQPRVRDAFNLNSRQRRVSYPPPPPNLDSSSLSFSTTEVEYDGSAPVIPAPPAITSFEEVLARHLELPERRWRLTNLPHLRLRGLDSGGSL